LLVKKSPHFKKPEGSLLHSTLFKWQPITGLEWHKTSPHTHTHTRTHTHTHPVSLMSIFTLSSHLHLALTNGPLLSGFQTRVYIHLISSMSPICSIWSSLIWSPLHCLLRGMSYEAHNWTYNSESVKSGISTSSTDVQELEVMAFRNFPSPLPHHGNKTTNLISCNSTAWLPSSVSLSFVHIAADM